MPKLTDEQKVAYIADPSKCPACGSERCWCGAGEEEEEVMHFDLGGAGHVDMRCMSCKFRLTERWQLVGIEEAE